MPTKIELWKRWVEWCGPGGGSFGYGGEAEDREGIFWANDVVNAAREVANGCFAAAGPSDQEKMDRLRELMPPLDGKVWDETPAHGR